MPLRPIDAIFVHPERRLYVIYFRGKLWQLPRMKIDAAAWQRRQPYDGDTSALYLRRNQSIADPELALQLRTLHLPTAVQGSTLPRFEAWWEANGFKWLKDLLNDGVSPLAAHPVHTQRSAISASTDASSQSSLLMTSSPNQQPDNSNDESADGPRHDSERISNNKEPTNANTVATDIFAEMLAELSNEVLDDRR